MTVRRLAALLLLLPLAGLLAAAPAASAQEPRYAGRTVHVDHDGGDDARDGLTPATARKTVPPPETIGPGTRILFKGGVRYPRLIYVRTGGTAEAPVVYDGNSRGEWGEGRAILDGSVEVGPWTPAGTNPRGLPIWSTPLAPLDTAKARDPGEAPILFQDDRRARLATSADVEDNWRPGQLELFFAVPRDRATDAAIVDPERVARFGSDWRGARLHLHYGNNHLGVFRVQRVDRETGTIHHQSADKIRAGPVRYALLNHPDVLDVPGEFLLDEAEGRLLYIPFDGADPNRVEMRAPTLRAAFGATAASHVVMRGFRVTLNDGVGAQAGSNRSPARVRGVRIEDNEFVRSGGVVLIRADEGVVRDNSIFEPLRGQPIFVRRSDRVRVEGNIVRRGTTGITAYGATNSLFAGNDTRETLGVHGNAMTIYEGSHNTRVVGNVIVSGLAGTGLTLRESDGLTIAFNVIRASRLAVAQWAQTPGGDAIDFLNNTFLGPVRIRPETAAKSRFVNNYIVNFEMQKGLEAFPVRVHNVYGGRSPASVKPERYRTGEAFLPPARAFRFEGGDALDVRPAPSAREVLARGTELRLDGLAVSHVGALDPDGRRPDLSQVGLPPHRPDLAHR